MTPNPELKVKPLFIAESLRNGEQQRHSYNGTLTRTDTHPTQRCHFE